MKLIILVFLLLPLMAVNALAQEQEQDQEQWPELKNNPSQPLGVQLRTNSTQALVLQSLLISKNRRLAQINGRLLKVGEKIGIYKLVSLNHDGAVLNSGDHEIVLKAKKTNLANTKIKSRLRDD